MTPAQGQPVIVTLPAVARLTVDGEETNSTSGYRKFFTPPLTTVRQDFNEMGRRSLHLLLAEIEAGRRSNARATVPASLVVRTSTSALR